MTVTEKTPPTEAAVTTARRASHAEVRKAPPGVLVVFGASASAIVEREDQGLVLGMAGERPRQPIEIERGACQTGQAHGRQSVKPSTLKPAASSARKNGRRSR